MHFLVKKEKGENDSSLTFMKLKLLEIKAADMLYMESLEGKKTKGLFCNFIFMLLVC